jgi:hypothetical protein
MKNSNNEKKTLNTSNEIIIENDEFDISLRNNLISSWKTFKTNFDIFLKIQILSITTIIIVVLVLTYIDNNKRSIYYWEYRFWNFDSFIMRIFKQILLILISGTFGLSYEVLSNGNESPEFKIVLNYIKQNWKNFAVVSLIMIMMVLIENIICIELSKLFMNNNLFNASNNTFIIFFVCTILDIIFEFLFLLLLSGIFTSLISQGNLLEGIRENIVMFKKRGNEVIKIIVVLYCIFVLPFNIASIITNSFIFTNNQFNSVPKLVDIIFLLNENLIYYIIVIPLCSITFTHFYNSVDFKEEKRNEKLVDEEKNSFDNIEDDQDGEISDLAMGWIYFKNNILAFLGVQLFACFPILSFKILYTWIGLSEIIIIDYTVLNNINYFFILITGVLLGGTYGLAYDILSSGNEFTEFKRAFIYVKKNWWKYLIITLFMRSLNIISNYFYDISYWPLWEWVTSTFSYSGIQLSWLVMKILRSCIHIFFDLLWMILFFGLLVSVTSQGNLFKAFKENFKLLKSRFMVIIKSIVLIFGIFSLVFYIFTWLNSTLWINNLILTDLMNFNENLIDITQEIFHYLVLLPMIALVSTLIYNSKYPPKGEINEEYN